MIQFLKVVSALPGTLTPDAVYAVRVGTGYDLYVADSSGATAHRLNNPERLTPRTQTNNTATIALYTAGGTMRVDQPNAATDYTITIDANAPKGAYDEILINAATEPTVNGSSTGKITGATFAPNTDMYLVIRTPDGTKLEYFFLEI